MDAAIHFPEVHVSPAEQQPVPQQVWEEEQQKFPPWVQQVPQLGQKLVLSPKQKLVPLGRQSRLATSRMRSWYPYSGLNPGTGSFATARNIDSKRVELMSWASNATPARAAPRKERYVINKTAMRAPEDCIMTA